MKKTDKQVIDNLIKYLGGRENILSVTHCITRLRLVLGDTRLASVTDLENLPMVKGCFTNAGQFQVVIGPEVGDYYQALLATLGRQGDDRASQREAARNNMSFGEKALSHIADIFFPLLPALISGGLILGFRNVIGDIPFAEGKTLAQTSVVWQTLYDLLWLPGEAIFMFLPVAVCWSTVVKMGGTPVLGIVLGITLVSPQLMNAYQLGQQLPEIWNFGVFSVQKIGYQAQVIPSVLAGMALALIERQLQKIVPAALNMVIIPVVSLLVAIPLAHGLIGPFGRMLGDGVAWVVSLVMTGSFAPAGSAIFGFLYAPLVITGIHQTTLAIDMQMIQKLGGTPVWPLIALSNIAQASAVLAIILIRRTPKERGIAIPAAVAAYLGVTEPAMYGVNIKYRYPMLCAMTGSALASLLCGLNHVMANGIGVGGLPGILSIKPEFWPVYSVAILIAIIVPLVLTLILARYFTRKELAARSAVATSVAE